MTETAATGAAAPGSTGTGAARIDRLLSGSRLSATMPWILGVMIALATLATGAALAGGAAALQLRGALSQRLTIQVIEGAAETRGRAAAQALSVLRSDGRVARATLVPEAEVRALIAPYLGTDTLDPDLPVPALIDVTLTGDGGAETVERLSERLRPLGRIRVDRTAQWAAPVSRFLTLSAGLALTVLGLTVAATTAAVVLAARAALDAHRPTIATLHLLGATDTQVSQLFERRVVRDGLGGIAGGTLLGLILFLAAGERVRALGEGFAPEGGSAGVAAGLPTLWLVCVATLLVPVGAVLLTRWSTRRTVLRSLRRMR